jgi:hypothetical protein
VRVTLRVARWRTLRPPLWRPARWLLPVRRALRRLTWWLTLRWLGVRALSVRWLSVGLLSVGLLSLRLLAVGRMTRVSRPGGAGALRRRRWVPLARRCRRGAATGLGRWRRSAG